MPLDAAGFGSPSNYEGMLIVPQSVADHLGHTLCFYADLVALAADLFAKKIEISSSQLYLTTAAEVTTGHLINHKGRICLLGMPFSSRRGDKMSKVYECVKDIQGDLIRNQEEVVMRDFPKIVQKLISEGLEFDAIIAGLQGDWMLCEVDIVRSRISDSVTINYPINGFWLPPSLSAITPK